MLALAFLGGFLLYLMLSIVISKWVAIIAGDLGLSRKKSAVVTFIFMMELVFWDWLPMEILFKYECSANAGLFVEKTIDDWKQENPGVWNTLHPEDLPEEYFVKVEYGQKKSKRMYYKLPDGSELVAKYNAAGKYRMTDLIKGDGIDRSWLNQRFYYQRIKTGMFFHIYKEVLQIIDFKTNQAMVAYVDYATDIPPIGLIGDRFSDYKFWMQKSSCQSDNNYLLSKKFNGYMNDIENGGK
jgi:hypothetical protein